MNKGDVGFSSCVLSCVLDGASGVHNLSCFHTITKADLRIAGKEYRQRRKPDIRSPDAASAVGGSAQRLGFSFGVVNRGNPSNVFTTALRPASYSYRSTSEMIPRSVPSRPNTAEPA